MIKDVIIHEAVSYARVEVCSGQSPHDLPERRIWITSV